jgi:hypothetical protein
MIPFFVGSLTCLGAFFRSRYNLGLEILALRHQLGVLKRKHVWSKNSAEPQVPGSATLATNRTNPPSGG